MVEPHNSREPISWTDGVFRAGGETSLPVGDAGFVLGATVTEQLRTFSGRLFLPAEHQARLSESLAVLGLDPGRPLDEIFAAAAEVAARNHAVGPTDDDLGVVVFVTPGDLPAQHGGRGGPPRTVVHSFPLAFRLWAPAYAAGVSLRSVSTLQVPQACWPVQAKVRSRLHYFLADREAHAAEAGARALLCHADGRVSETSTANVAAVLRGGLVAPPPADALAGVSLRFARRLAESLGIPWSERSLSMSDLAAADEVLLTSTPNCILPATRLDGRSIGAGSPGPVHSRLLAAWSDHVGIDIAEQARRASA